MEYKFRITLLLKINGIFMLYLVTHEKTINIVMETVKKITKNEVVKFNVVLSERSFKSSKSLFTL